MAKKIELKQLGFFADLPHGGSLSAIRREQAASEEAQIVAYLRAGELFIASPGVVFDVIDRAGPIGSGSVMTDGHWAWPDDLPAYVQKYHLALPEQFVQHVRANNWQVPTLTLQTLRSLTLN